jgi:hypothetical protein
LLVAVVNHFSIFPSLRDRGAVLLLLLLPHVNRMNVSNEQNQWLAKVKIHSARTNFPRKAKMTLTPCQCHERDKKIDRVWLSPPGAHTIK